MSGNFIFDEPFGHTGTETKIERFLASTAARPLALSRERTERFDPTAVMTYSPMKYIGVPWSLDPRSPNIAWLIDALQTFVRGEFPTKPRRTEVAPIAPILAEPEYVTDGFLESFLRDSEASLMMNAQTGDQSPDEMAANIYELLCNKNIGSSRNRVNNVSEEVIKNLSPVIAQRSRLLFILPGFPFKDQNIFRVPYEASEPDLADISFMIRLHRLTQAIYQVHPFGADILVLTDGSLYADIFDVASTDSELYARRMLSYRNQLNLQGTVSFFPLRTLIERTTDGGAVFWNIVRQIESDLEALRRRDPQSREFQSLSFGMRRNMQTRGRLSDRSMNDAWDIIWGDPSALRTDDLIERRKIDQLVDRAAITYAAVNLALRWTRLIERSFPGALRGTVHAKPGQFALAGTGGAYAWNGVAVARHGYPQNVDDIVVRSITDLDPSRVVVPYYFRDGLPAFFGEEVT